MYWACTVWFFRNYKRLCDLKYKHFQVYRIENYRWNYRLKRTENSNMNAWWNETHPLDFKQQETGTKPAFRIPPHPGGMTNGGTSSRCLYCSQDKAFPTGSRKYESRNSRQHVLNALIKFEMKYLLFPDAEVHAESPKCCWSASWNYKCLKGFQEADEYICRKCDLCTALFAQ